MSKRDLHQLQSRQQPRHRVKVRTYAKPGQPLKVRRGREWAEILQVALGCRQIREVREL